MERADGWYRDESGNLRYWNGTSWAGKSIVRATVPMPAPGPARPVTKPPPWRLPVMTLGWIAAIFTLGMLLTGVAAESVDCGYVLAPEGGQVCAAALQDRTTMAGVTAAAALLCFAAGSRATPPTSLLQGYAYAAIR